MRAFYSGAQNCAGCGKPMEGTGTYVNIGLDGYHKGCEPRADLAPDAAYVGALRATLTLYEDALTEAEAIFGGEYGDHYGPMCELAFAARDARAALAAKPQAAPVRVVVKPLEWRKSSAACEIADTPWGSVAVQDESHALAPKRWGWWMVGSGEDDSPSGYGIDIDAAKAAAQADYERRILSALAGQP